MKGRLMPFLGNFLNKITKSLENSNVLCSKSNFFSMVLYLVSCFLKFTQLHVAPVFRYVFSFNYFFIWIFEMIFKKCKSFFWILRIYPHTFAYFKSSNYLASWNKP